MIPHLLHDSWPFSAEFMPPVPFIRAPRGWRRRGEEASLTVPALICVTAFTRADIVMTRGGFRSPVMDVWLMQIFSCIKPAGEPNPLQTGAAATLVSNKLASNQSNSGSRDIFQCAPTVKCVFVVEWVKVTLVKEELSFFPPLGSPLLWGCYRHRAGRQFCLRGNKTQSCAAAYFSQILNLCTDGGVVKWSTFH